MVMKPFAILDVPPKSVPILSQGHGFCQIVFSEEQGKGIWKTLTFIFTIAIPTESTAALLPTALITRRAEFHGLARG